MPIDPQQYWYKEGETTPQYNARIAALRGETPTPTSPTQTDPYEQLIKVIQDLMDKLIKMGQVLNPNIEITPEKAAEFLAKAQTEIDPYYSSQLKLARESLLSSIGYSKEQILTNEKDLERKYGINVRQLGEQAAEQGFALSGIRQRAEQQLATETQANIEQQRRQLEY